MGEEVRRQDKEQAERASVQAMVRAWEDVVNAQRACWKCSILGPFGRLPNGELVGGSFHTRGNLAVGYTLKQEDGRCTNCGHITTEPELAMIKEREVAINQP